MTKKILYAKTMYAEKQMTLVMDDNEEKLFIDNL